MAFLSRDFNYLNFESFLKFQDEVTVTFLAGFTREPLTEKNKLNLRKPNMIKTNESAHPQESKSPIWPIFIGNRKFLPDNFPALKL